MTVAQSTPAVFQIDPDTVERLVASLRADADSLAPLSAVTPVTAGPTAAFTSSLATAIACVNERTAELSREARRLADVMELTVSAAQQQDSQLSKNLGVMSA
ncbi:hypothetical protein CAPI_01985 [Corynebacterium capitovis DSM 44611]|uniref:hypothetical protein n=1 Tax=Corynebacterium capitovis TaxID=131081 RepID=UPI00036138B8|nr:hypothetical protein [Corynebacterium capitovis]WKD56971.1 hypothetical protein CAPI_01985 [Corynebacterium capitovis DSM 44611]